MELTICTKCEWFVHDKCVSPNAPITDFIQGTKSLLENAEGKCRYYQKRSYE